MTKVYVYSIIVPIDFYHWEYKDKQLFQHSGCSYHLEAVEGWGLSSVSKALVMQACEPEFNL